MVDLMAEDVSYLKHHWPFLKSVLRLIVTD
jgi:hypothetical protein